MALGRVIVGMSSFPRAEDTPTHPWSPCYPWTWELGDGHLSSFPEPWAFLESPQEGTASWSGTQPSHQPAAPLPAMREHAAHIPVPTLPSHLKSSQLGFSREGRRHFSSSGQSGSRPCRQPGTLLFLWGAHGTGFFLRLCWVIYCPMWLLAHIWPFSTILRLSSM